MANCHEDGHVRFDLDINNKNVGEQFQKYVKRLIVKSKGGTGGTVISFKINSPPGKNYKMIPEHVS